MKDPKQQAITFYRQLYNIVIDESPMEHKVESLYALLSGICLAAVEDSGMQFHTLFSVLAYTGHKYRIPKNLLFNLHQFRRRAAGFDQLEMAEDEDIMLQHGLLTLSDLIRIVYKIPPPPLLEKVLPARDIYYTHSRKIVKYKKLQRVLILEKEVSSHTLLAIDHEIPDEVIKIKFNIPDRNEDFNPSVDELGTVFPLPIEANLLDIEIDESGLYQPRALVIQPDFLIDITSIAECFKSFGISPVTYLTKKFLPLLPNKYLMLGHTANFFLDELMADPKLTFQELIGKVFLLNPLSFTLFDDSTIREVVNTAQKHFANLKVAVQKTFPKHGIVPKHAYLEPTFYSERYGIQGRLDVLFDNPDIDDDASIIELKSGKPYKPNVYGLSQNHYIQTLLYDLLIKSVSDEKLRPTNYILYSVHDQDHLRFAPAVKSQQYEALAVRNILVAIEYQLSLADQYLDDTGYFTNVLNKYARKAGGFIKRDLDILANRYEALTAIEKKYFLSFVAFIAREHRLAKIGLEQSQINHGQSSLWLQSRKQKEDQFNILSSLSIVDNFSDQSEPIISFRRTENTNPLANFRQGDLALLYPSDPDREPLRHQLFKGTIIHIDHQKLSVRLRAKQFNHVLFTKYNFWNLEHDLLDSSFSSLYQSLFSFSEFPLEQRKRFLSMRPPLPSQDKNVVVPPGLTPEQAHVFAKIIASQDYFLLWGPPGTGKTSIMLKSVVQYLVEQTDEQILLMAYTNRAVDEICRALDSIGPEVRSMYYRIGSKYATHPDFKDQLLNNKITEIKKRKDLQDLIENHRIVVGTFASIAGKKELFILKQFDRVIIDEATQIIEPMMAGLLPRFNKVLLIGDHKQLSAVVTQPNHQCLVDDPGLKAIGLTDLSNSYFERLFNRCEEEDWHWAFDKLSYQGRMHQDIMAFPSKYFYDDMLKILPHNGTENLQNRELAYKAASEKKLSQDLIKRRVLFFPVETAELFNSKTNEKEARLVVKVIKELLAIYKDNDVPFKENHIGVITPFRAQIAKIKAELSKVKFDPGLITIDTVERYQGGARTTIIISLCINSEKQLDNLVSLSSEGIDRKLNVALTRAREQLIVIGDPEILGKNPIYKAFIDQYTVNVESLKSE